MESKRMEAAVLWLSFVGIPLNETAVFYRDMSEKEDGIIERLTPKLELFGEFGASHVPSFCADNAVVFPALFELAQYRVNREKLFEVTKFCLTEWIRVISQT